MIHTLMQAAILGLSVYLTLSIFFLFLRELVEEPEDESMLNIKAMFTAISWATLYILLHL